MPKFRLNVKIKHKGVIFDKSQTKAIAARTVIRGNEVLAQEAVNRITRRLDQVLVNPTGYYRRNIVIDRRSVYRGVSDNNVPYGGWLEGVDRRNKTTRFPGYHTFRLVKQELDRDKGRLMEPVITQMVRELGS